MYVRMYDGRSRQELTNVSNLFVYDKRDQLYLQAYIIPKERPLSLKLHIKLAS